MKIGFVICAAFFPVVSTAADALDRGDSLLDLVQEVLSDASRPLQPDWRERNTQSRFVHWLREVLSSSSAVSHSSLVVTEKDEAGVTDSDTLASRRQPRKRPQTISDTGDLFESEMHEGARLISASFRLIADTFGLVADGVRISGDTAAGVIGSSVKQIGTAVKWVSSNFDSAGRLLEPNGDSSERRKTLTSERLRERRQGEEEKLSVHHGGVLRNTRSVAGQSVRLIGSVIRGVGDTLLLAGEATETIASSTTGVAEDLVRLVEDFAGSLSLALSPNGGHETKMKTKVKVDSIRHQQHGTDIPYVTFGSYAAPGTDDDEAGYSSLSRRNKVHLSDKSTSAILVLELRDIVQSCWEFVEFLFEDTQGVPSFAAELLGVIIICFLASHRALYSNAGQRRGRSLDAQVQITDLTVMTNDDEASMLSHEFSDFRESSLAEIALSITDKPREAQSHDSRNLWRLVISILFLPFKTILFILSIIRRVVFSRVTFLFAVYGGAWIYLCRASQLRSSAIQR